jgi:hypothetical protein
MEFSYFAHSGPCLIAIKRGWGVHYVSTRGANCFFFVFWEPEDIRNAWHHPKNLCMVVFEEGVKYDVGGWAPKVLFWYIGTNLMTSINFCK